MKPQSLLLATFLLLLINFASSQILPQAELPGQAATSSSSESSSSSSSESEVAATHRKKHKINVEGKAGIEGEGELDGLADTKETLEGDVNEAIEGLGDVEPGLEGETELVTELPGFPIDEVGVKDDEEDEDEKEEEEEEEEEKEEKVKKGVKKTQKIVCRVEFEVEPDEPIDFSAFEKYLK